MENPVAAAVVPDLDRPLAYPPPHRGGGLGGRCRLRVWAGLRVAMATEIDENPGLSVTNAAESLWTAAEQVLAARLDHPSWILVEHYPATPSGWLPARFDVVLFAGRDRRGDLEGAGWIPAERHGSLGWLLAEPGRW